MLVRRPLLGVFGGGGGVVVDQLLKVRCALDELATRETTTWTGGTLSKEL